MTRTRRHVWDLLAVVFAERKEGRNNQSPLHCMLNTKRTLSDRDWTLKPKMDEKRVARSFLHMRRINVRRRLWSSEIWRYGSNLIYDVPQRQRCDVCKSMCQCSVVNLWQENPPCVHWFIIDESINAHFLKKNISLWSKFWLHSVQS